jgi:outer membrane protein TolC
MVMLEDRLSQIDKQERNATLMLTRWVGADGQRPVSGAPAWQRSHLDGGRLDEHFQYHPDLIMLRAQVDAAQTEARLAEANKKSDWSVEAAYSQRGPAYSNMIGVGVSIPFQWDQKNRQDRELSAKLAMVEQVKAEREEALRMHVAETRVMIDEWQNGRERHARYERELIPLANDRTQAAIAAYRGGKSSLADVLAARRNEIDVRIQALQLATDTARLWAQINFLFPTNDGAAHAAMFTSKDVK